eukprot:9137441-Alexandrium_andersonii.AAC.1
MPVRALPCVRGHASCGQRVREHSSRGRCVRHDALVRAQVQAQLSDRSHEVLTLRPDRSRA